MTDQEWDMRGVPVGRLRALVALLGPDEMTPMARRMLLGLCDEIEHDGQEGGLA